jgi:hypothetical protein
LKNSIASVTQNNHFKTQQLSSSIFLKWHFILLKDASLYLVANIKWVLRYRSTLKRLPLIITDCHRKRHWNSFAIGWDGSYCQRCWLTPPGIVSSNFPAFC